MAAPTIESDHVRSIVQRQAETSTVRLQFRFSAPVNGCSTFTLQCTMQTPVVDIKQQLLDTVWAERGIFRGAASTAAAVAAGLGVSGLAYAASRWDADVELPATTMERRRLEKLRADLGCPPLSTSVISIWAEGRDTPLPDFKSLHDLGYEHPPLLTVVGLQLQFVLRARGLASQFAVGWRPHMTTTDLARAVYSTFAPRDMRALRVVFQPPIDHLPQSDAPIDPEPFIRGSSLARVDDKNFSDFSLAKNGGDGGTHVGAPIALPLAGVFVSPREPSLVDPEMSVAAFRAAIARSRASLVARVVESARDVGFNIDAATEEALTNANRALSSLPRHLEVLRSRDGRHVCFRASRGDGAPLDAFAIGTPMDAVLQYCEAHAGLGHDAIRGFSAASGIAVAYLGACANGVATEVPSATGGGASPTAAKESLSSSGMMTPEMLPRDTTAVYPGAASPTAAGCAATAEAGTGERPRHADLASPFDDDDEELAPRGLKRLHVHAADLPEEALALLDDDFAFRHRRAHVELSDFVTILDKAASRFYAIPVRCAFFPPAGLVGPRAAAAACAAEFLNGVPSHDASITSSPNPTPSGALMTAPGPRFIDASLAHGAAPIFHLSDFGVAPDANLFVEFFEAHERRWSPEVAAEVHAGMRARADAAGVPATLETVPVRSERGSRLQVPVIFAVATTEDVLRLAFCATGDLPMFSMLIGPDGNVMALGARLCEVAPSARALTLRCCHRPRAWLGESLMSVISTALQAETV